MTNEITKFEQENQYLMKLGVDEPTWNALCETLYPSAAPESVMMVLNYCKSRNLDVMLKPVHLVPMKVKDRISGQDVYRDVVMPGIGSYRIQADRSGTYAGADEPEFGPLQVLEGTDKYKKPFKITYPEWCKYTVHKTIGDRRVSFIAKEYWLENYATQAAGQIAPNSMWQKRPYAQLAKCTEAQALRKGWPEIGSEPIVEEMEGKHVERDITPVSPVAEQQTKPIGKEGSLLNEVLEQEAKPKEEVVIDKDYDPNFFTNLELNLMSCDTLDGLESCVQSITNAINERKINEVEHLKLKETYKKMKITLSEAGNG